MLTFATRTKFVQKYRYAITFCLFAFVVVTLSSNSNGRATQANAGNTGAPGETTCAQCHGGSAFGTVSVIINIFEVGTTDPVLAYVPGTTYDMRVTVNNTSGTPGGRGFQMTCLTTPGNQPLAGYSNLASNVKQKTLTVGPQNGRTYVEHNGVTPNNQFNFQWTAPAVGQGSVRFTASGNSVNLNNATSGDGSGSTFLVLPQAQALTASVQAANPTCAGSANGSIMVTVNTGVPPYSFLWSDGSTAEDRTNLAAGTYGVTITDAVGQQFTEQATLTAPPALTTSATVVNALFPDGQGSVNLVANGGTPNYTFTIAGIGAVANFPLNIAPGTYNYTVTDNNNCTTNASFTVTAPQPLVVDVNTVNVSCFGAADGALELVSVVGATPPYTFTWSQGEQLTNLDAGVYGLLVTDAVGYNLEFIFEIDEPEVLELTTDIANIGCFGEEAEVTVSAIGGTAPFSGTGTFSLAPGDYTFDVVDANGCTTSTSVSVVAPTPLEVATAPAELPCAGGVAFIEVEATGGTPPYQGAGSIEVNFAGTYPIEVIDANGCTVTTVATVTAVDGPTVSAASLAPLCFDSCDGSIALSLENATEPVSYAWSNEATGASITDLCSGNYSVSITDGAGCVLVGTYSVANTPQLQLNVDFAPIACFGGSTQGTAVATGGTGETTITWLNSDPINLEAGFYEIMVTDENGCSFVQDLEITEPELFTGSATLEDVACFGTATGSIVLELSGGTGTPAATWSNGSTSLNLVNVVADTYSVVVTDGNGCIWNDNFTLNEPELLEVVLIDLIPIPTDISLGGGSIAIDVTGGTPPYSFVWNSGQTTQNIELLAEEGNYAVTVTDALGCTTTLDADLTTSIFELVDFGFQMYPNPARAFVTIASTEPIRQVTLLDLQGRVVFNLPIASVLEAIVNVETLPVGSYYLQVVTEAGAFSKQFFKN